MIQTELAEEPSMGEMVRAVKMLKAGKFGENSEILPEMVKDMQMWLRGILSLSGRPDNSCMHGGSKKFGLIGVMQ